MVPRSSSITGGHRVRVLRAICRLFSHPVISAGSNVYTLLTLIPGGGAILAAIGGALVDQPALFYVAVGLALVAILGWVRDRRFAPSIPPPTMGSRKGIVYKKSTGGISNPKISGQDIAIEIDDSEVDIDDPEIK